MPAGSRPHIVVVGSINMDLVARVARLPRPGETVPGENLVQSPGGKGANQAVAAARLGARCTMIGRVGDDLFGVRLIEALAEAGVETDRVRTTPGVSSGVALIGVEASGQNMITIVAGANGRLMPEDVEAEAAIIAGADALIVQLEVPLPTVQAALAVARRNRVLTVLDPAPAPGAALPPDCHEVDVLSPNQSEAEALTGVEVRDEADARRAARNLLDRGARRVVLKMGAEGAFVMDVGEAALVPTARIEAIDTTAAGDAFTAALALGLAEGRATREAIRRACAAGTLAATRFGAQQAMPTADELETFLELMPW